MVRISSKVSSKAIVPVGKRCILDFDQIRTFLEVSRQKSFSRAAVKLLVTQPSISAQISSLEKTMGVRLFERGGGKVTLTAAGRVFEPFAEDCISRLNHISITIADLERSPRGSLLISANDSTALYVLPAFFANFKKRYPRVSLNIVRAERAKTIESVLNREADFGVVSLPVNDPRLHVELIHEDEWTLCLPPDHPLCAFPTVTLKQISQHNLLLPKSGRRREHLDRLFAQSKLRPRIGMELDSYELLKRLIIARMGIGFLPRINILAEIRGGILHAVATEGVTIPRNLALISRMDRKLTRAGHAFYNVATRGVHPTAEDNEKDSQRLPDSHFPDSHLPDYSSDISQQLNGEAS
jgi:DNA-binding transcriptional LysR family regulator